MTDSEKIIIKGARVHNLKKVDIDIPKKKLVVFTGVSGSGKSSLVFDTIYSEAQYQLLQSFSSFQRRRLSKTSRPDVEEIKNISTAIIIDQKRMGTNPRSTVGTVTEIYTYLRLLFSRCGTPRLGDSSMFSFNNASGMCPNCNGLGKEMKFDLDKMIDWDKSLHEGALQHPDFKLGGWYFRKLDGTDIFDFDKPIKDFSEEELHRLLYSEKFDIENHELNKLFKVSYEGILTGILRRMRDSKNQENQLKRNQKFMKFVQCTVCNGSRLNEQVRSVKLGGKNIAELTKMELDDLYTFMGTISGPLADRIVRNIRKQIKTLIDVGVGYVSLNQPVGTLSGGEAQRIKMARQLGSSLVDMIYILDEPSIGLHPRDLDNLIHIMKNIRDSNNTVLVVEHDPEIIQEADYVVDIGPKAGKLGGEVMFNGTVPELLKSNTITSQYLNKVMKSNRKRRTSTGFLEINHANLHNLKDVNVKIPLGVFVCVTGVSGSGKSTLINDIFCKKYPKSVVIDQSAVSRNRRANPLTYTKTFDLIRRVFSKATGHSESLFSFNSEGACPKCKGLGMIEIEMNFMDDVRMKCNKCNGMRFKEEVLNMKYKGKNIHDVLKMSVKEALDFFENENIRRRLEIIKEVGLEYLELGQPLSTLSGGECQRIKIASELRKKGNIYIMDEPTTGLHMADIEVLQKIIDKLVNKGNTVLAIEHNLDIIKNSDWIIDLGPEGGKNGGTIIFEGIPEQIVKCENSYTGKYLKNYIIS